MIAFQCRNGLDLTFPSSWSSLRTGWLLLEASLLARSALAAPADAPDPRAALVAASAAPSIDL